MSSSRWVRGSVTNGGLWFDDADCAATFQTPGEVKADQLSAFGQCLAGLELQASARKDALLDVAVMHYAPGFEVQARIQREMQQWTFEPLKVDGTPMPLCAAMTFIYTQR